MFERLALWASILMLVLSALVLGLCVLDLADRVEKLEEAP